MPGLPLPDSVREFLARPNPAVVATVGRDGRPHTAATWYLWENDHVMLSMDSSRVRLQHLARDPRISLTVIDGEDWYRHVTVVGTVETLTDDDGLADIDALARHYTGEAYKTRDQARVTARVRVERWHGWDAAGERKVTHAQWGE
jgi:PPOX class probable F420-dependent enzyme